jgi:hypothetical protein
MKFLGQKKKCVDGRTGSHFYAQDEELRIMKQLPMTKRQQALVSEQPRLEISFDGKHIKSLSSCPPFDGTL